MFNMATIVPAPKQRTFGGGDILRLLLSLEQMRTSKESIALRKEDLAFRREMGEAGLALSKEDLELRRELGMGELDVAEERLDLDWGRLKATKGYYDILGRDVDIREKKFALTSELDREIKVAQAMGDKSKARILKMQADYTTKLFKEDPDRFEQLVFSSEILAATRATNRALQEQVRVGQLQIQQQRAQMQYQNFVRLSIQDRLRMVDSWDLPPDVRMTTKSELTGLYKAQAAGKAPAEMAEMAEMGIRTEAEIFADVRKSAEAWRELQLKEVTAKEKRAEAEDRREVGYEEAVSRIYKPTKMFADHFEERSWVEYEAGLRRGVIVPVKEIPTPYKIMDPLTFADERKQYITEKRAKELGIHDVWLKAPFVDVKAETSVLDFVRQTGEAGSTPGEWDVNDATNRAVRELLEE